MKYTFFLFSDKFFGFRDKNKTQSTPLKMFHRYSILGLYAVSMKLLKRVIEYVNMLCPRIFKKLKSDYADMVYLRNF